MKRKCDCAGGCGPEDSEVSRRGFIELVGIGATGALMSKPAAAAARVVPTRPEDLERWKKSLLGPAEPRVYPSQTHTDARMHLGGIGTGNFEIGSDGRLTTWQLFNTLKDGETPFAFLLRVGKTTRWLQTQGAPDGEHVAEIEMKGEYPFAFLKYRDPALPVEVELKAFTPFAPLDSNLSSWPLAAFVFRVYNPTDKPQEVSLAALMTNPVGYDANRAVAGVFHPNFGGNVNEPFHEAGATGLVMRAVAGEPTLDKPTTIVTLGNLSGLHTPPHDRPKALTLHVLDQPPEAAREPKDLARTVIWLADAPADLAPTWLKHARAAVEAGATLVFSGRDVPLLRSYGSLSKGRPLAAEGGRPDIVFEDFEHGYRDWKVEGAAFGPRPATGTLPGQQPVIGFRDKALVNSFFEGDDTTGRLVSRNFTIERTYIRFLIGGGSKPTTQLRLVIDEKVVRAAAGKDVERLEPGSWDVREFLGKTARIEIVDEQTGGWGHINVDQITFSDHVSDRESLELLDALLPARFRDVAVKPPRRPGEPITLELVDGQPHPDAQRETLANGLVVLRRKLGAGQVILALGPILETAEAGLCALRHRAYATLCGLVGANYTAPPGVTAKAPGFGTLALATLSPEAGVAVGFDDWGSARTRLIEDGRFDAIGKTAATSPTAAGRSTNGAVSASLTVAPGASVEAPFLLAWHYPNKYTGEGEWVGCHYATGWPDAAAVLRGAVERFAKLRETTEKFHTTFYDSTLPYWLLDCLSSQAAIIRHIGVVFRIANGDVYGWEGSNGCCPPTCTHVWGYEQSLARLFPDLEKEMRRIDFRHQQRADGGVNNRTHVPSPPHPTGEQPFADGHASCVLKAYREALNHPDDSWFKSYWPNVERAVEYLIARDAAGSGGVPDGILQDDQWNTYDEALHGVTTFISGYYLAALRAGEEWARRVGDAAAADRFHAIFLKGAENLEKLCWNGEYYQQKLDDYMTRPGEVGPGCMSDQLIGQWWAHQLGLGYLLPRDRVRSALGAVFKYNWKPDLTGWKHVPRAFAGDGDKGLIICTWPRGGRPPHVMLYSDEVWTGIEYQVAAHMIYEGMIEEAFAIVKSVRDRYDGVPREPIPRNPWNEIECGGHYARAMSSWSLLLALSGYEYDGPAGVLRFAPRVSPENFRAFFCGPEGWGSLSQTRDGGTQRATIAVASGRLPVSQLRLVARRPNKEVRVTLGDAVVPSTFQVVDDEVRIKLDDPKVVQAGEYLVVTLS
jgi:non-lysosomal glucosylceramidase